MGIFAEIGNKIMNRGKDTQKEEQKTNEGRKTVIRGVAAEIAAAAGAGKRNTGSNGQRDRIRK